MSTVTSPTVFDNLRAAAELLSLYPSQTVLMALDALGASLAGIPADLLDLCGAVAVEAIEAELLVRREGWAA